MSRKKGNRNGQQAGNSEQEIGADAATSEGAAVTGVDEVSVEGLVEVEPEAARAHEVDTEADPEDPPADAPVIAASENESGDDTDGSNGDAASVTAEVAESEGEPLPADVPPSDDASAEADASSTGPGTSENADQEITTEHVVEAILFASETPLSPQKLVSILGTGSVREIRKIVQTLNKTYARTGHAFRIEEIAGGYQLLTLPEYNTWLRRLKQSRQESKLSPAAMETLAVVAYKQPVVRVEIEAIRGVSVGETLNRLRELGLVKIVGRAEDVGRPMLYGTTRHFLELFGLSSLEDLPAVEELQPPQGG